MQFRRDHCFLFVNRNIANQNFIAAAIEGNNLNPIDDNNLIKNGMQLKKASYQLALGLI